MEAATLDRFGRPRLAAKRPIVIDQGDARWVIELDRRPMPDEPRPPMVADGTDGMIADMIKTGRRMIEDGHVDAPSTAKMARLRGLQVSRFCLRMRYGARDRIDGGTDVWDLYERLGWAPSYWLATNIDRLNAEHGRRHVLAWPVKS